MSQLSFLQMTDASSWKGLTTENHLGALWQQAPHKVSDLITKIQSANFGDLDFATSDPVEIALTLQYDYAILQF